MGLPMQSVEVGAVKDDIVHHVVLGGVDPRRRAAGKRDGAGRCDAFALAVVAIGDDHTVRIGDGMEVAAGARGIIVRIITVEIGIFMTVGEAGRLRGGFVGKAAGWVVGCRTSGFQGARGGFAGLGEARAFLAARAQDSQIPGHGGA